MTESDTADVEEDGCRTSGCGSSLGTGAVFLMAIVLLAGFALRKKNLE